MKLGGLWRLAVPLVIFGLRLPLNWGGHLGEIVRASRARCPRSHISGLAASNFCELKGVLRGDAVGTLFFVAGLVDETPLRVTLAHLSRDGRPAIVGHSSARIGVNWFLFSFVLLVRPRARASALVTVRDDPVSLGNASW